MRGPSFKERMAEGRAMLGTFLQIPSGEAAEIAGSAGLDFGIVDTEHGMLGTDASLALIRGCDAVGLTTIYRVPLLDHHRIGLALDMGASAVMVPNVVSREQAEEVIDAATPHLDCIFIGPYDLSQSMGMPGAVTDDRVLGAMKDIVQRAADRGIAMANFPVTIDQAKRYRDIGVRFLAFGTDTLVLQRAYRDCRKAILGD